MSDETEGGGNPSRFAGEADDIDRLDVKQRLHVAPSGDRLTDWGKWDEQMGNPPATVYADPPSMQPPEERARPPKREPKPARAPKPAKPQAGAEGARLATLLEEHGITAAALAESFGASPKFVETVLAGKAKPLPWMFAQVEKICADR